MKMESMCNQNGEITEVGDEVTESMLGRRKRPQSSKHELPVPRNPLSHLGMEGARHMVPERLPSAKRERAVTTRLIDCTPDTLQSVQQIGAALKRLDMSNLYLMDINDDVLKPLTNLEKLDVSYNELTEEGFPKECQNLENLQEISAHYNNIAKVPKVFRKLKNLNRLKLGYNNLRDTEGVEKMKRLIVLVLEHNKIDSLGKEFLSSLRKLEILHCGCNLLKEIPTDVRHLKHLKDIDISNNRLSVLPRELFMLRHLESVNASGNQISRIPSTVLRRKFTKNRLSVIDLSDNTIIKFPEHLIMITDLLDASSNKIKSIQGNFIRKLDLDTDQILLLNNNPTINPPAEICDCGLKAIMNFFQEGKAYMKVYQGLKVLVIGPQGGGKTSLVQSLVDQQPRLTEENEETIGVDLYDMSLELPADEENEEALDTQLVNGDVPSDPQENESSNDSDQLWRPPPVKQLLLSIWDFSGHKNYLMSHYFFLEDPALTLLVFDLQQYSPENFKETIGSWLDWYTAKMNKLVVLPVGTHADKLPKRKVQKVCQEVSEKIREHMDNRRMSIEKEIKRIEARKHISPSLSEQLKQYISLLKVQYTIFDNVLPVSSTDCHGTEELLHAIETMALNKEIFPDVMRIIPSLWVDVETFVEDKGDAMDVPIIHWEEYSNLITKKYGMKHLLEQITSYLHDIGKVLWYSKHPTLKDYVILRPAWLADVIKAFFRHDLDSLDYTQEDTIRISSVTQFKFEKLRNEYLETGTVDRELLKCLWATAMPKSTSKTVMEIIGMVVEHMGIGYTIKKAKEPKAPGPSSKKPERRGSSSSIKSIRSETMVEKSEAVAEKVQDHPKEETMKKTEEHQGQFSKIHRARLPWCLPLKSPTDFRPEYEQYLDKPSIVPVYRFPKYLPPGFFESMAVIALQDKHKFTHLHHWQLGLYAKHTELPIRIYLQRINHDDQSTCLRLEFRNLADDNEEQLLDVLWRLLLPYLRDIDELVTSFKGARVTRHMECPFCHSLQFLGEWLTPKEFQALSTKLCDFCKKEVNTGYLVQPKEKKRSFWISKIRQMQRERKQGLSSTSESEETADDKESNKRESLTKEGSARHSSVEMNVSK